MTSIIIPDSVTIIGSAAFSACSSLTSIVIGDSVTRISGSAFSDCSKLTNITIPASVKTINEGAFEGCSNLTSAIFEDTTGWEYWNNYTWVSLDSDWLTDASVAADYLRRYTMSNRG